MADFTKITDAIKSIAPEALQESWDNSGIQVSPDSAKDYKRIMTALEISDGVVQEAVEKGVDMIVTHHPLIFSKLASVSDTATVGNQIITLIKNNIAVYSAHTSFDSAAGGTNSYLAEKIGLTESVPMIPAPGGEPDEGMGRVGRYASPLIFGVFLHKLETAMGKDSIRIAGNPPQSVETVALCTGSGAEFIDLARELGADVYITGDLKYHDARHADDTGFCVIDAGHHGTEVIFAENMAEKLRAALGENVEIIVSETDIYPFR